MVQALRYESCDKIMSETSLVNFLINRVKKDLNLATLFYWYISVECPDKNKKETRTVVNEFYEIIHSKFLGVLEEEQPEIFNALLMQNKIRERFKEINEKIRKMDLSRKKEELRKIAGTSEFQKNIFQEQSFCLNTNYHITSMEPEECTVFKSAMAPLRLCFHAYNVEEKEKGDIRYKVIFKSGDDLRQDQLIIQMITLMDSLLKGVNVDCQLTPYKVLACSKSDGFLEFVPDSNTLQEILLKEGTLTNFFKKIADEQRIKDENLKKNNLSEIILNNFVDSCAGYCVITYFLGIGDRHKENLMITNRGLFLFFLFIKFIC